MVEELSQRLASDLSEAVNTARRVHSESLNQALRRLRLATSEEKTLDLLSETCGPYAERPVVLVLFEASRAHGGEVEFELIDAPAVTSAIETRDPLVCMASADQLSPALAAALAREDDDEGPGKAFLFPIVSRHAAVAMLVASGQVDPSPVELLCEAAGMRLESFSAAAPVHHAQNAASWDDLSADDQRLHLQAQRITRVRVAEIRLYEEEALRRGLAASDLYRALQTRIDDARREFLQLFLSKSATMVDYLHLELLRSLVHDDVKLLGPGYPGPMV